MSDWIEHDGKSFPEGLDPDDMVLTKRGDWTDRITNTAGWWHGGGNNSNWVWPEEGPGEDYITHYRVVK